MIKSETKMVRKLVGRKMYSPFFRFAEYFACEVAHSSLCMWVALKLIAYDLTIHLGRPGSRFGICRGVSTTSLTCFLLVLRMGFVHSYLFIQRQKNYVEVIFLHQYWPKIMLNVYFNNIVLTITKFWNGVLQRLLEDYCRQWILEVGLIK